MLSHRLLLAVILVSLSGPLIAQETGPREKTVEDAKPRALAETPMRKDQLEANQARDDLSVIQTRQKKLKAAITKFDELIRRQPPAELTPQQLAEWNEQTRWLKSVRDRYQQMNAAYSPARGSSPMREMAKLNAQFLALQNAVQMESRKYQTISNASKARHDVAMAAIRNTRA